MNDTEYRMLKEAYSKCARAKFPVRGELLLFNFKAHAYELKTHQICAEDIIRDLERYGITSSYSPKRDSITQQEFEEIADKVFGSTPDVTSFRVIGHIVKAIIWSRFLDKSYQVIFDFDDNGKITGASKYNYSIPFPEPDVPMLLRRELRSRIRSALYK